MYSGNQDYSLLQSGKVASTDSHTLSDWSRCQILPSLRRVVQTFRMPNLQRPLRYIFRDLSIHTRTIENPICREHANGCLNSVICYRYSLLKWCCEIRFLGYSIPITQIFWMLLTLQDVDGVKFWAKAVARSNTSALKSIQPLKAFIVKDGRTY